MSASSSSQHSNPRAAQDKTTKGAERKIAVREIAHLRLQIRCLEKILDVRGRIIDQLKRDLDGRIAANEDLVSALSGLDQELTTATARSEGLERVVADSDQELAVARRRNGELQSALDYRDQELAAARRRNGELQSALDNRDQELAAARRRNGELQSALDNRDQELAIALQRDRNLRNVVTRPSSRARNYSRFTAIAPSANIDPAYDGQPPSYEEATGQVVENHNPQPNPRPSRFRNSSRVHPDGVQGRRGDDRCIIA